MGEAHSPVSPTQLTTPSVVHHIRHAVAGLARGGQDVQPLHHAEILMGQRVAMHDKAPDRPWIEVDPKRDRSPRNIIYVWLLRGKVRIKNTVMPPWRRARTIGLRRCARNKHGVMPLGRG